MFGCDLLSPRKKYLVTNSAVLSAKIIERETYLAIEPHSVLSLALRLYQHPAVFLDGRAQRKLTAEELEFLGEELRELLPNENYFKKAFELPGLRERVLRCVEELRLAGYEPHDLQKNVIDNEKKLNSIRVLFELYLQGLKRCFRLDFVEIKSGKARLGDVEKRIRKTVESGKVSLELFGTKRE